MGKTYSNRQNLWHLLAGKPTLPVPREVTMMYCCTPKSLATFTSLIAASPSILLGAPKSNSLVSAAPIAWTTYTDKTDSGLLTVTILLCPCLLLLGVRKQLTFCRTDCLDYLQRQHGLRPPDSNSPALLLICKEAELTHKQWAGTGHHSAGKCSVDCM